MRPLKLTMNAFGPYADETFIDFAALGTAGVYLVCGDTGAGKTMIFDALCFALFGEASGDAKSGARSTSSMRSDYALSTSKTFVELVFEYRGNDYRIRRNPEYMRSKERGLGQTKQQAAAELELPDGRTVSGVRNVNAEVEELLGIDSGQFKQIVMLAQGEFRKLLTADTATREGIFRKLFHTRTYEQLQERFAADSKKLERDYERVKTRVRAIADQARFPADSSAAGELEAKKATGTQFGSWLEEALGAQLDADKLEHARLEAEVAELRTKWSDANALLKLIESRPRLQSERDELQGKLQELKTQAPALQDAFDDRMKEDARRSRHIEQAVRIEGTFSRYEESLKAVQDHKRACDDLAKAEVAGKAAAVAFKEAETRLESVKKDIVALEGADVRLAKAQSSLDDAIRESEAAGKALEDARKLQQAQTRASEAAQALARAQSSEREARESLTKATAKRDSAKQSHDSFADAAVSLANATASYDKAVQSRADVLKLVEQRSRLARELGRAQGPYERKLEELKDAETGHDADVLRLHDLRKRQRAGRAGLLAAELEEGEPCPVCGSEHHPAPAPSGASIPADAEIDEAAERERQSGERATSLSLEAEGLRAICETRAEALQAFDAEHGGEQSLLAKAEKADQRLKTAQARRDDAEVREKASVQAKKALERATREFEEVEKIHEAALEACRASKEESIAAGQVAKTLRASVGETDIASARKASDEAASLLGAAKASLAQAQEDAQSLDRKRSELAAAQGESEKRRLELGSAQEASQQVAAAKALAEERLSRLQADLEFASLDEARHKAADLRAQAQALKAARDAAEQALIANGNQQATTSALLEEKSKQLEELPPGDAEQAKLQRDEFHEQGAALNGQASTLKSRIDANGACLANLRDAMRRAGDIEDSYGRVKKLADVATGQLRGRAKVRFEAYVQAIYFDKVIAAANERLKLLTNGQFELVRYSEGAGNAKAGLGLYVIDSFTGRMRDASSLSGGESFQASLCLALGLSDVVQAHAGGIEFDTMFVDEGFGSLDQGALGNAISLLSDLSGGSKLVGIISHVEDLKTNIPKKIYVTKTRTGSSIEMEL